MSKSPGTNDKAGEGHLLADKRRKHFSVREVADYLGVSCSYVYQLVDRGGIEGHRFGKAVRVSRAEILRFEEAASTHKGG